MLFSSYFFLIKIFRQYDKSTADLETFSGKIKARLASVTKLSAGFGTLKTVHQHINLLKKSSIECEKINMN